MFTGTLGRIMQWFFYRVGMIYLILFFFCFTCVDLKMLEARIKIRHLNSSIPDFSDLIIFSQDQNNKRNINWDPYKKYFELILRFMPDDVITKPLLGYVDFYSGQEQRSIDLFKSSAVLNGQNLFWPNYNLGVLYYKKAMWSQAAEYLLKAAVSDTRPTVLAMRDSIVYRQIFASPVFNYSLRDEINDAQSRAIILLLSSLIHMRQYDQVIVLAHLAIANQDLSYQDAFYYYMGLALLQKGQGEKAFWCFQKSLTIQKDDPYVYYYIALILEKAGKKAQARDFLHLSYVLHHNNDPRFPYEAHLNLRFF